MVSDPLLVALALALVVVNAFFVAAEFAMVRVRATRVATLAAEGHWQARILAALQRRLDVFLSATQLGITLSSLGLGWIGEPAFAHLLVPLFAALGIESERVIENTSIAVAFATITVLHILLAESHRVGVLSGAKRELLENVIDYTERTARHVMVPRADIAYLSLARSLEENLAVVTQTAATRYPLAATDVDHVVGMVHVKDLFNRRDQLRSSEDLAALKREILFVPDTRPLDALQKDFQQRRTHMAIVVDEYGG